MKTLVIFIALMLADVQDAQAFTFFNFVKSQEAMPLFQNVTLVGLDLGYYSGGRRLSPYNYVEGLTFKTQDEKQIVINLKEQIRTVSFKATDKIDIRVMKVVTTDGKKLNCLSKIIINQEEIFVTEDGCNEVTIK